jgi:hypothetical protein
VKLVYIAGKFRGANAWEIACNVHEAEAAALRVAELGGMPVVPHSLGQHMAGTLNEDFWLAGTMLLLSRCDGILLLPSWGLSHGARAESDYAEQHGIDRWGIGHLARPALEFVRWLGEESLPPKRPEPEERS